MSTTTLARAPEVAAPDAERSPVRIGSAEMPYRHRDPATGQLVASVWPVRSAEAPYHLVGEIWRNVRTGQYTAWRKGWGVSLQDGPQADMAAAADVVGWTVTTR
jgi:hypothetical protein